MLQERHKDIECWGLGVTRGIMCSPVTGGHPEQGSIILKKPAKETNIFVQSFKIQVRTTLACSSGEFSRQPFEISRMKTR